MDRNANKIVIVTQKSRLQELLYKYNTYRYCCRKRWSGMQYGEVFERTKVNRSQS